MQKKEKEKEKIEIQPIANETLATTHMLICGSTGAGKSVAIKSIIYKLIISGADLILCDPKRVELNAFSKFDNCICYADDIKSIVHALRFGVSIMEKRYKKMKRQRLRQSIDRPIYIVIDELADLMQSGKKEVEPLIVKIAQLGRAAGIHLIVATQDPRRVTISAAIQSNMTTIVALRCRSAIESRLLLQQSGAEKLPKYGEALLLSANYANIQRIKIDVVPDSDFEYILKCQKNRFPRLLRPLLF